MRRIVCITAAGILQLNAHIRGCGPNRTSRLSNYDILLIINEFNKFVLTYNKNVKRVF